MLYYFLLFTTQSRPTLYKDRELSAGDLQRRLTTAENCCFSSVQTVGIFKVCYTWYRYCYNIKILYFAM